MTSVGELKQSALQSAAYDTVLQVCLRVVSFVLNSLVLRSIGPAMFAVCSVRLLLLYSSTLLLTREAFRRAAMAASTQQINHRLVNLVWLGFASLLPVGGVLGYVWCSVMSVPPADVMPVTTHYTYSVVVMLLCCAVELLAEVPFVLAELQLWAKTRVLIEGLSQVVRSVLIAGVVTLAPSHAVIGYCICHLIGSCFFTASYYAVFYWSLRDKMAAKLMPISRMRQLMPSWPAGHYLPPIDGALGRVARGFMVQGWLKELLTEGEWFLMNLLPLVSLTQQGTYQVVSNLGALGARLVFRSIETAAYKFFAQSVERGTPLSQQDQTRVRESSEFLWWLLRGLSLLGLTILTFGWSYSRTLLQLYGGQELSSSGYGLLRAQCLLLLLLALNGVTEAYTFAAMSTRQLSRHSGLLVLFSLLYLGLCAGLSLSLGAMGFVAANSVNMMLRIAHGWLLIHRQYSGSSHRHPLAALLLPASILTAFAAAFLACAASEALLYPVSVLLHVAMGGCVLLLLLFALRHECRPLYTGVLTKLDAALTDRLRASANSTSSGGGGEACVSRERLSSPVVTTKGTLSQSPETDMSNKSVQFSNRFVYRLFKLLYSTDDLNVKKNT